ncbi:hypothetical protein GCM10009081_15170 [Brevundimonas nasdae]
MAFSGAKSVPCRGAGWAGRVISVETGALVRAAARIRLNMVVLRSQRDQKGWRSGSVRQTRQLSKTAIRLMAMTLTVRAMTPSG